MRRPAGAHHQPADARRARHPRRQRPRAAADRHPRAARPGDPTSSSNSTGRSGSGSGAGQRTTSTAPDGQLEPQLPAGSSSTGRSCTSCETSVRSRPSAGSRSAASGTVTRVPGRARPRRGRLVAHVDVGERDRRAPPGRTTTRPRARRARPRSGPRPARARRRAARARTARAVALLGQLAQHPEPPVDGAASSPTPSSAQRISKRQLVSAGTRSARICARHARSERLVGRPEAQARCGRARGRSPRSRRRRS